MSNIPFHICNLDNNHNVIFYFLILLRVILTLVSLSHSLFSMPLLFVDPPALDMDGLEFLILGTTLTVTCFVPSAAFRRDLRCGCDEDEDTEED